MKRRILSVLLIFIMLFSALPVFAAESVAAYVNFESTDFTSGEISAHVSVSSTAEEYIVFMCYYNNEGTMLNYSACTPTLDETLFTVDTPSSVSTGDYVKVIVVKRRNLEPVTVVGTSRVECTNLFNFEFDTVYDGISERYYTIDSENGSLSVSGKTVSLAEEGTPFRLKDMTEGYFAFESSTNSRYRLEYTGENGVRAYFYSAGSANQRWIFEKSEEGYAIRHANGGYLAVVDSAVTVSDTKYYWDINFHSETPFSLVTNLDGFSLLTEAQQQRVIEICTSIGADAMPYAPNNSSFLDTCEKKFTTLYNGNYTAEAQKAEILSIVSRYVVGELAESGFYYPLQAFPGSDAEITQKAPVKTKHIMWDLVEEDGVIYSASDEHPYTGAAINCYRIDVTYTTEDTTQKVAVYCVDPSFENVQTAISALGKFPYAYRKNIKNMYVYYSSTTSTYNCGGEELFVRLKGTANETTMIKSFAHELGHSNDYMANGNIDDRTSHWNQSAEWQLALENDIATISNYGNSNTDEGFAEFARLYWLCYGNRDLQIGIKQLFPNRFASFQRMLTKIGCEGKILY